MPCMLLAYFDQKLDACKSTCGKMALKLLIYAGTLELVTIVG